MYYYSPGLGYHRWHNNHVVVGDDHGDNVVLHDDDDDDNEHDDNDHDDQRRSKSKEYFWRSLEKADTAPKNTHRETVMKCILQHKDIHMCI